MDVSQHKETIARIAIEVLSLGGSEQSRALRLRCPDPELREAVRRHLREYAERCQDFLEPDLWVRATAQTLDPSAYLGRDVGNYRLIELAGGGGMGDVFKAEHVGLKKLVALKIITPRVPITQERQMEFRGEWQRAGQIRHENVVGATDAGVAEGIYYLAMEWLEGADLAQALLRAGPFRLGEACGHVAQAARGLAAIHRHGIVHRDVKPSNLFLPADGVIKIIDLGMAKAAFDARPLSDQPAPTELSVCGTIDYMPPEQWGNPLTVDAKADVYALGCTFYELLQGYPPFATGDHIDLLAKWDAHASETVVLTGLACGPLPDEVAGLIGKMLSKNPADRPDAEEVALTLEKFMGGPSRISPLVAPRRNPRRRQSDMEQLVPRLGRCRDDGGRLRLCEYHSDRADVRFYQQQEPDLILSQTGAVVRIARTPSTVSLVAQMQHKTEVAGHWGLMAAQRLWLRDQLVSHFKGLASSHPPRVLQCGIAGHVHYAGAVCILQDALRGAGSAGPATLVTLDKCCGPVLLIRALLDRLAGEAAFPDGEVDVLGFSLGIDPTLRAPLVSVRQGRGLLRHELHVGDVTDAEALARHGPFDVALSHFLVNMWTASTRQRVEAWAKALSGAVQPGGALLMAVDLTIIRDGLGMEDVVQMLRTGGFELKDSANVWDVYDLDFAARQAFLEGQGDLEVVQESVLLRYVRT